MHYVWPPPRQICGKIWFAGHKLPVIIKEINVIINPNRYSMPCEAQKRLFLPVGNLFKTASAWQRKQFRRQLQQYLMCTVSSVAIYVCCICHWSFEHPKTSPCASGRLHSIRVFQRLLAWLQREVMVSSGSEQHLHCWLQLAVDEAGEGGWVVAWVELVVVFYVSSFRTFFAFFALM